MQQDLERLFSVTAKEENRLVNSLVLKSKRMPKNEKAAKTDLNASKNDSTIYFNDISSEQFIRELTTRLSMYYPFFDETGYAGTINCAIKYSSLYPINISSLKYDLRKAGYDLFEEKRLVPVLVVRQKPGSIDDAP